MTTISKRRFFILLAVPLLLLIPLLAMQFTGEVDWSAGDFLIMGLLLFGLGLGIDVLLSRVRSPQQRMLFLVLLILSFLLLWAELAVGIFGTPFAGS
jgi:uncharacterized membrane protein YfhO